MKLFMISLGPISNETDWSKIPRIYAAAPSTGAFLLFWNAFRARASGCRRGWLLISDRVAEPEAANPPHFTVDEGGGIDYGSPGLADESGYVTSSWEAALRAESGRRFQGVASADELFWKVVRGRRVPRQTCGEDLVAWFRERIAAEAEPGPGATGVTPAPPPCVNLWSCLVSLEHWQRKDPANASGPTVDADLLRAFGADGRFHGQELSLETTGAGWRLRVFGCGDHAGLDEGEVVIDIPRDHRAAVRVVTDRVGRREYHHEEIR